MNQLTGDVTPKPLKERDSLLPHWCLVGVTLLIGIGCMYFTYRGMNAQVKAMKRQNEAFLSVSNQGIRPYAVISVDTISGFGMAHRIGKVDTIDGEQVVESMPVQKVVIGSYIDKAKTRTTVGFSSIVYTIKNTGRLPMYLTGIRQGAELSSVWVDSLAKDYVRFCEMAWASTMFKELETDVHILPGGSITLRKRKAFRTISPAEFERLRDDEHEFIFYPFIYIQYEDPFNKKYDVLHMNSAVFKLGVTQDNENQPVTSIEAQTVALERFRWDVLINPDS